MLGPGQAAAGERGIVSQQGSGVRLESTQRCAMTYVAATLQSVMQLAYFVFGTQAAVARVAERCTRSVVSWARRLVSVCQNGCGN